MKQTTHTCATRIALLASTSCLPVILALNHLSFSFAQLATSRVCCPRNPPPSPAPLSTPIFSRPPSAESGALAGTCGALAGTCGAGESGVHVAVAGTAQGVMTFAGVLKPGAGAGAGCGAAAAENVDAGGSGSSTAANADDACSIDGAVCGGADRHGPEDEIDERTEEVDGAGACSLACSAFANCVCVCVCVCARARARDSVHVCVCMCVCAHECPTWIYVHTWRPRRSRITQASIGTTEVPLPRSLHTCAVAAERHITLLTV